MDRIDQEGLGQHVNHVCVGTMRCGEQAGTAATHCILRRALAFV